MGESDSIKESDSPATLVRPSVLGRRPDGLFDALMRFTLPWCNYEERE
jgi:hypothetical protein